MAQLIFWLLVGALVGVLAAAGMAAAMLASRRDESERQQGREVEQ